MAVRYVENKDLESAHKLITANLRFVIKIANEYIKYGLRMIDLIQEGNIGLMRAVKTYNPYKDTRLITYAVWWIRSYIHDYIQRNWSMVKMGTTQAQRRLFYRLKKEKEALERMNIDIVNAPKLIADKLGIREKDVIEMDQRLKARDLSLDAPISKDDETTSHLNFIADEQGNVEEILSHNEESYLMRKQLKAFESSLKDRDLFIYQQRLVSDTPMTLQAIADRYKISKERARQLEVKIKKNLKNFLSPTEVSNKTPVQKRK